MAKREEFELHVVESMKPQSPKRLARPRLQVQRHSPPTRGEALDSLRAAKNAEPVIKSVPMLERIETWVDVAYWNVCTTTGSAEFGVFLWDCDFPGYVYPMSAGYENCIAYFAGAEDLDGIETPRELTGQVWCYLNAPVSGTYLFSAQVETYLEEFYGPDYVAVVEFAMDYTSFGTRTLYPGQPFLQSFLVNLSAGNHTFMIWQTTGAFFFEGLTAWNISLPLPAPGEPNAHL